MKFFQISTRLYWSRGAYRMASWMRDLKAPSKRPTRLLVRTRQDAVVVLEDPQEHGDQGVALQVVEAALFQEDVCLVQQDHAPPGLPDVENRLQVLLDELGLCPDITACNRV